MRTVKQPDVRKQEILDGAIRVFAQKGYDKATIATIAKELNISQGLCYRYFPSKEDIYNAAIEKYADLILDEFLKNRKEGQSLKQRLENIPASIKALTAAETRDSDLYTLFHSQNGERLHSQLLLKVAEKILPYIQQMLADAKNNGEITVADPRATAIVGLYGQLGVFFTSGLAEEQQNAIIRDSWDRLLGI